jgi:ubiquitin-like-conjugating enzyme ATG3
LTILPHFPLALSTLPGETPRTPRLAPTSADQTITEIPDISDSPTLGPSSAGATGGIANLSLSDKQEVAGEEEIPDMDDIPDMVDEGAGLEEEDDAAVKIVHPSA